jgi:tetratricopeptide (TPR) repeat protein
MRHAGSIPSGRPAVPVALIAAGAPRKLTATQESPMTAEHDDPAAKRARFIRELATRDLYAWFGIPRDADADQIREAAERRRRAISGTPMPQRQRSIERAFCDQGEKALLRPDIRRDYDALLDRGSAKAGTTGALAAANKAVQEREARLRAARERIQHYGPDDTRMVAGSATLLASDEAQEELAGHYRAAAAVKDSREALSAAREARARGQVLRGLAFAERAHAIAVTPATLNTLGAARRDTGDLAGSEQALRASVKALPTVRENAPGWTALAATLRARGELVEADAIARKIVDEEEEDAHGWRILAMVAGDREDVDTALKAWEKTAELGLDVPGVLAALDALRKDRLARGDARGAAEVEMRMARLRLG